ncbi:MAG: hypothetical protein ACE5KI_05330 [Dehalococcoidia bacterium]
MPKSTLKVYIAGVKRLTSLGLQTAERFRIALISCRGRYFADVEDQMVVHTDAGQDVIPDLKLAQVH